MSTQAPQVEETLDLSRPSGSRTTKNGVVSGFMILATALAIVPLAWLLASALHRGLGPILHASWWANTMDPSLDVAKQGALHAIVGTLAIGLITSVISIPIALLMVPTVLRSTEEMLKLVPDSLREASYALGVSKWRTIFSVVLPTSISGVLTGIVLGLARVLGETAPLMVLVQYNTTFADGPGSPNFATIPTIITDAYTRGGVNTPSVWGAAVTLIILVMGLNLIARAVSRRYLRRMGK